MSYQPAPFDPLEGTNQMTNWLNAPTPLPAPTLYIPAFGIDMAYQQMMDPGISYQMMWAPPPPTPEDHEQYGMRQYYSEHQRLEEQKRWQQPYSVVKQEDEKYDLSNGWRTAQQVPGYGGAGKAKQQQQLQYSVEQILQNRVGNENYYPSNVVPQLSGPMQVKLKLPGLWKSFHVHVNEMVVTNRGRDLFPHCEYIVTGLKKYSIYKMGLKLILLSPFSMKYHRNRNIWEEQKIGQVKVEKETNEIFTGEKFGSEFMHSGVDFKRAKIYNIGNEARKKSKKDKAETKKQREEPVQKPMMLVTSQYKYIPQLTIYEVFQNGLIPVKRASIEETQFVVVTGYKNPEVQNRKGSMNTYTRGDVKKKAQNELEFGATSSETTTF